MQKKQSKRKIRVVIADDHPLVLTGLAKLLYKNSNIFEIVGEAKSGLQAYQCCIDTKPDVLVTDWHMPGDIDGSQLIDLIKSELPCVKIFVLTMNQIAVNSILQYHKVDRCLVKESTDQQILETLFELVEQPFRTLKDSTESNNKQQRPNKFVVVNSSRKSQETADSKEGGTGKTEATTKKEDHRTPLTGREVEILVEAAAGFKPAQIAENLGLSEKTVTTHLHKINQKLNVNGIAQAISFAVRHKIIPPR